MGGEVRTQLTECFILDTTIKEILNVADVGEFGPMSDDIDVTNLESVGKEFLVGLPDNGEITLQINHNPADLVHRVLEGAAGGATRYYFYVGLSDGTADPTTTGGLIVAPTTRSGYTFYAAIKSYKKAIKANDAVRVNCTLRLSGAVTNTYKA